MDWIKVLNKHTLHVYTDLSPLEFQAWIKIMSLAATLEDMPTRDQMLQYVHHKTLTSLQDKLKTHATTLQDILKKVLSDAQEVVKKREYWKDKRKEKRAVEQNVHVDIQEKSLLRLEESREEKSRVDKELKASEPFRLPSKDELENSARTLILENIDKAADDLYEKQIWPKVHAYKNAMLKRGCNERAILKSLMQCLVRPPRNPWAYCSAIMQKEDGNFNARDYEKNHG